MDTQTTIEVIAPTVDEAIQQGLQEIGLPEDAVDIVVLDEGSRGLFGLGSRQARVRLIVKTDLPKTGKSDFPTQMDETPQTTEVNAVSSTAEANVPDANDKELNIAKQVISELVQRMHITAEVTTRFLEAEDNNSPKPIYADIHGKDLSLLIGKQAETLNALQYIARMIISKEVGHSVSLIVDVEGYRQRREVQLKRIAQRMAEQVINTGKSLALEPMPPNERRIIHLTLKDHPKVYTHSIGEGQRRKVVIYPRD